MWWILIYSFLEAAYVLNEIQCPEFVIDNAKNEEYK